MTDAYDLVVIGGGSAGEYVASELAGGRRVLLLEDGFVGGECPYVACIPSKVLLIAGEQGESWAEAVRRRDSATAHRDDSGKARRAQERGVTIVRERGRVREPGIVEAGGTTYAY